MNIIIKNASVYTVDEKNPKAQAIVIEDGVIAYVGDKAGAAAYEHEDSNVIDMQGHTVMPAMVDAHMHPGESAVAYYFEINLQDVMSVEEYCKIIADFVAEHPEKTVYVGAGYMRSVFDEVGPRKEDLDKIVPDKPVVLQGIDGHSVWVNSKAMELAGITKDTKDPEGGIIQRDPVTGEPSGLLMETAMNLVENLKPLYTVEEYKEAIKWLQGFLNERGITTIFDAMIPMRNKNYYMAFEELAEAGELTIRVRGAWHVAPEMGNREELMALIDQSMEASRSFKTDHFQVIAFKFFADQVLEEKTAYMLEPYTSGEPGWRGIKVWNDEETLLALLTKIDKEGFQNHIHQIGDAAAKWTVDMIEKVREANGNSGTRHIVCNARPC